MAFKLATGVWETTDTEGTEAVTLLGAKAGGWRAFSGAYESGDTTYYFIKAADAGEWGLGTVIVAGSTVTLERTTVYGNSAGTTNRLQLGSGIKEVYGFLPAEKTAVLGQTNVWGAHQDFGGFRLILDEDKDSYIRSAVDDQVSVWTADAELVRFDGSGTARRLTLFSADSSATEGPEFRLSRLSPNPAVNDTLGVIRFNGNDSAENEQSYAKLHSSVKVVTNGAEEGRLHISLSKAGAMTGIVKVGPDGLAMEADCGIFTGGVKVESNPAANGAELLASGQVVASATNLAPLILNLNGADGQVASIRKGGVEKASWTIAGETLSYGTFTGGHWSEWASFVADDERDETAGTVVCSTEEGYSLGRPDLPRVRLSQSHAEKLVYGVIAGRETIVDAKGNPTGTRLIINGLGAGMALCTGPVYAGDLLCTSDIPGVACRQGNEDVKSWTLGKALRTDSQPGVRLVACTLMAS